MSNLEEQIAKILRKEKIKFEMEKTFSDLRGGRYRYDFYIKNYNGKEIIIEVDGPFHFKAIHGRATLLKQQEHDRQKNSFCLAKGIILYRLPFWEISNIKTFSDICQKKFLVKSRWFNDEIMVPKEFK